MKCLIIDELSIVSSDLCAGTNLKLRKAFMMIPEKAFDGVSVMTANYLKYLQSDENLHFSIFW